MYNTYNSGKWNCAYWKELNDNKTIIPSQKFRQKLIKIKISNF